MLFINNIIHEEKKQIINENINIESPQKINDLCNEKNNNLECKKEKIKLEKQFSFDSKDSDDNYVRGKNNMYEQDDLKNNMSQRYYKKVEDFKSYQLNKKISNEKEIIKRPNNNLFFEVIRGKKRKNMQGFECKDCKSFYNEIYSDDDEGKCVHKNFFMKNEQQLKKKININKDVRSKNSSTDDINR
ncbi:hypothetical protein PFUGPA_01580 [Plasmodium falciparum Palo Alto/Uganda]|uniref:DNA endonuclease activator Ctp1 C-terminal domain-containing protein n=1 Tax=Plasmodium falciparum (isolate Palo Alto / Uganda) TaxID=57270 RepID=W4J2G4_PLAFP|nr:hypothetical protein PFUGPA_01580 [Plasmodium falciparum Palo Alto/Uganda]